MGTDRKSATSAGTFIMVQCEHCGKEISSHEIRYIWRKQAMCRDCWCRLADDLTAINRRATAAHEHFSNLAIMLVGYSLVIMGVIVAMAAIFEY